MLCGLFCGVVRVATHLLLLLLILLYIFLSINLIYQLCGSKYIRIDKLEDYLIICRNTYIWVIYIWVTCCIFVCNLLPRLIKNLLSPLYLCKNVTSICNLSHKIELHLNKVRRDLQRFLLVLHIFLIFYELKYTPDKDFFPFF